jgi:hypothetical protein
MAVVRDRSSQDFVGSREFPCSKEGVFLLYR